MNFSNRPCFPGFASESDSASASPALKLPHASLRGQGSKAVKEIAGLHTFSSEFSLSYIPKIFSHVNATHNISSDDLQIIFKIEMKEPDVESFRASGKTVGWTHRRMHDTNPSISAKQLFLARFHDCSGCPVCSSRSPWIKRFILAHVQNQRNIQKGYRKTKTKQIYANLLDCPLQNKRVTNQSGISAAVNSECRKFFLPGSAVQEEFLRTVPHNSNLHHPRES